MRHFARKSALLIASLLACAPACLANQRDIQLENYQRNNQGSDDSLKNSTVYAMQALMDLAHTDLKGAMKNGYNAYGKFRNAENLDRLKDKNVLLANGLGSVDSKPVNLPTKTNTSFRRIDPSFLTSGEAGKVAAEFERQTGMKRGEFLTQMADISEQKIKLSDPQLIDKALGRFEGFLKKIPNAEFRKNAEKGIAMVPNTLRRGMVSQAVTKLAGFFADAGPSPAPGAAESSISLAAATGAEGSASGSAANASAVAGATEAQASAKAEGAEDKNPPRDPASLEVQAGANGGGATAATGGKGDGRFAFDNVVRSALLESKSGGEGATVSGEQTIFQQITKRYRLLTPQITKP